MIPHHKFPPKRITSLGQVENYAVNTLQSTEITKSQNIARFTNNNNIFVNKNITYDSLHNVNNSSNVFHSESDTKHNFLPKQNYQTNTNIYNNNTKKSPIPPGRNPVPPPEILPRKIKNVQNENGQLYQNPCKNTNSSCMQTQNFNNFSKNFNIQSQTPNQNKNVRSNSENFISSQSTSNLNTILPFDQQLQNQNHLQQNVLNKRNQNNNFSQYYRSSNNQEIYRVPIASIEPHLEILQEHVSKFSNSVLHDALHFQTINLHNKKLENYFNNLPNSSTLIVNAARSLTSCSNTQFNQIRNQFKIALHKKLPTQTQYMNELKRKHLHLQKLYKIFKEKNREFEKFKKKKIKNSNHIGNKMHEEIEKLNHHIYSLNEEIKYYPKHETTNDFLSLTVYQILYPSCYDFIQRQLKYDKVWINVLQNHINSLENFEKNTNTSTDSKNRNSNSTDNSNNSSFNMQSSVSNVPPIIKCDDRKEFKNEIFKNIQKMLQLEIVDKPD